MKLEIAYLRRKLELTNQINISKEKLAIQLDYAKKQIKNLQEKNKELEEKMFDQVK